MSSKEVKALLKAAKVAVGKKNYEEVIRLCQEIFVLDASNYTAHVFAGLAALELGSHGEARQHYKTAIGAQPQEQLAWKGLANFYDKCSPNSREDQVDAVQTYQRLLLLVEGDLAKTQSTLRKLASLHKTLGSCDEAVSCYSNLIATYDKESSPGHVTEVWTEVTQYLLRENYDVLSHAAWEMLERGVAAVIESPTTGDGDKMDTRVKYTQLSFTRFLQGTARDCQLEERVHRECQSVLHQDPSSLPALSVMAHLILMDVTAALPITQDVPILSEESKCCLSHLHGNTTDGMGCVGQAVLLMVDGKWKEAGEMVAKGVSSSPRLCEGWILSSHVHLHLHTFTVAQQHAMEGLKVIKESPVFMARDFENGLKLCLARAHLGLKGKENVDCAISLLTELAQTMSTDSHMTSHVYLVKALLLQEDASRAEQVLRKLEEVLGASNHAVLGLQGELYLARKEYITALEKFSSALEKKPGSADYQFSKGLTLWEMLGSDKTQAYAAFLQAAKLNPFNPDVFLHIGHYQKGVTKDLKRAAKCYQKAVDLQPSHTEAAVSLGDVLFASGDEEAAFHVYRGITSAVPQAKAKQAWLRMGLYHRKNGLFNHAIKSFQNALAADPSDKHCWECLGEAYLTRGSHNSALRAFTKAVELDSKSLYCLYQLASIKQLLGLLRESVIEYTTALEIESSYVPALKGRGESNLELARQALTENFDGRAVDHVSLALRDLTSGARLQPQFTSLWKLIGDCCTCLCDVALQVARVNVPKVLIGQTFSTEECEVIEKKQLLFIGSRAYGRALQLSPETASLWHDLAMSYYYLRQATGSTKETLKSQDYLHTALSAMKKAISLQPHDPNHWNALGFIATHPEMNNSALAQHAFIKSIQEENNVVAWTNLGALYLKHGNIKLAHQAFRNAQSLEPDYVQAWIGQALVAESIGHSDSMDLFRHTTELAYHPEGSSGYGYWVCHTLGTLDRRLILNPDGVSLNPIAQRGALQARDCLLKYVERQRHDACGFNLLGLLYEQEGLLAQAEKAFSSALEILEKETSNINYVAVKTNHARVLSALKRHSEAITAFAAIGQEVDLSTQTQLALTLCRGNNLSESLLAYEQVLPHAKEEKSVVLSAIAMVAFAQADYDKCKTMLFKAFQTPPPSLHGLVALSVVGCWFSDLTLVQAALQEILKLVESQTDVTAMLHPSCVHSLRTMRSLLQQNQQASECVESISIVLEKLTDHSPPIQFPFTLLSLKETSSSHALLLAQKLVHSYPSDVWSLAVLMCLLPDTDLALRDKYKEVVLHHVQTELNALLSRGLQSRLDKSQHKALLSLQKWANN